MKIRIEMDQTTKENEVIIRCNELDDEVLKIQSLLAQAMSQNKSISFYKDGQDYYVNLSDILFFETTSHKVIAHTIDDEYYVKHKLYELEELLPSEFVRVSKSTIVNIEKIYSILRNITSASKIEFQNTYKRIYVSRNYYSRLKEKLLEKRR